MHAQLLSCVELLATPQTVALQAHMSMGFSRQEYWSGLPLPFSRDLPNPGTEPENSAHVSCIAMQGHQGSVIYYIIFSNDPFSKLLFPIPVSRHAIDLNVLASKEGMFPTRDDTIPTNLDGRRKWQPTLGFLPGKFHEWRSLVDYSPWCHKEVDTTEWLSTHRSTQVFQASCLLYIHETKKKKKKKWWG